jgi:hypothetical protein
LPRFDGEWALLFDVPETLALPASGPAETDRSIVVNEPATKTDLALALETLTYRLTVQLGILLITGIATLAVLVCMD